MCDQGIGCGFFKKIGRFSVIFESQVKILIKGIRIKALNRKVSNRNLTESDCWTASIRREKILNEGDTRKKEYYGKFNKVQNAMFIHIDKAIFKLKPRK